MAVPNMLISGGPRVIDNELLSPLPHALQFWLDLLLILWILGNGLAQAHRLQWLAALDRLRDEHARAPATDHGLPGS